MPRLSTYCARWLTQLARPAARPSARLAIAATGPSVDQGAADPVARRMRHAHPNRDVPAVVALLATMLDPAVAGAPISGRALLMANRIRPQRKQTGRQQRLHT